MKSNALALVALTAACLFPATEAPAASSTASLASKSASDSVGSISDSSQTSSGGSSKTTNVAAGDYRVVAIAPVAERTDLMRMTLRAGADGSSDEVQLLLPVKVAQASGVAEGHVLTARPRPYGVEFVDGQSKAPLFLVMNNDWQRDLGTQALSL